MIRFERWRFLIQQCGSESELQRLMKEYVNTWLPSDLEKLPAPCRDLSCESADDLLALALHLTTCELKFDGDEGSREILQEVTRTFVAAAIRVGQLRPGPLQATSRSEDGT